MSARLLAGRLSTSVAEYASNGILFTIHGAVTDRWRIVKHSGAVDIEICRSILPSSFYHHKKRYDKDSDAICRQA